MIEDIEDMCKAGNATMAYFYFDFRDANKQGLRDIVTSLLTQLSARPGPRCDIISDLYMDHDEGNKGGQCVQGCVKRLMLRTSGVGSLFPDMYYHL